MIFQNQTLENGVKQSMSDLTNSLINATYKKLIQVSSSGNEGISGTLTNVQTGDGTNTALKLATSAAQSRWYFICRTNLWSIR